MTRAFRALLLEGLQKFATSGYASEGDLQNWLRRLTAALEFDLPTDDESRSMLRRILDAVYAREVRGGIARVVPGVSRYTIDRVAPHLRAELDRRIFAGVELIKLNKRAATQKTLQRFSGWVSSVPPTGAITTDLRSVAREIAKPASRIKFEARRVAIDQGRKLSAAVAHVVATGAGAIGAIWHDRGQLDHGYDARPEHLARSGKLFLVRDSWAMEQGLVRRGGPYTDEIEQPAEMVYCACYWEYLTTPYDLPRRLLTRRGQAWIAGKTP